MKHRTEYAVALEGDIEVLRASLDFGSAWTKDTARQTWGWSERRLRATVAALRERGYPVISTSEQGSTYRKAKSAAELHEFVERELCSRARHLEQQIRALREGAARHFGGDQLPIAI